MSTRPSLFINVENNNKNRRGEITKIANSRSTLSANSTSTLTNNVNRNKTYKNKVFKNKVFKNKVFKNKVFKNKTIKNNNNNAYRPKINTNAPIIRRELPKWQQKILFNKRELNNREMFWIHK
jgi:hypothetical protein